MPSDGSGAVLKDITNNALPLETSRPLAAPLGMSGAGDQRPIRAAAAYPPEKTPPETSGN